MFEIILFAGTSEGHRIADYLRQTAFKALILTATSYGKQLLLDSAGLTDESEMNTIEIRSGRLDQADIETLLRSESVPGALIIDATHPYAAAASENIRSACEVCERKYIRVLRKGLSGLSDSHLINSGPGTETTADEMRSSRLVFPDIPSAAAYLNQTKGNVLVTTGSKELEAYTSITDYRTRLFARVLSLPSVVQKCSELGFEGKHLICMQGPFSRELNEAMIRHCQASYLVTKDTGVEGGFPEKEAAAAVCNCTLIIISRPVSEEGISVETCIKKYLEPGGLQL